MHVLYSTSPGKQRTAPAPRTTAKMITAPQKALGSANGCRQPFCSPSRPGVVHGSHRRAVAAAAATSNCSNSSSSNSAISTSTNSSVIGRRELGSMTAASLGLAQLLSVLPAAADEPAVQSGPAPAVFVDPEDAFKLVVPNNWQTSEGLLEGNRSFTGASGARRTIAWYPSDVPADQVNVTMTITNTSVEFTRLGSFGNVFAFGTNLVNSMDRSFLLRMRNAMLTDGEPVQVAKLLDAKDTRGMYQLEYSVEKIPGPKRHLYSMVALAWNGRYNRLYTLTAQCLEEQVPQYEKQLLQVLGSFQPPAPATSA